MRRFLVTLATLCALGAQADTRVIELQSADPDALLPVVKPLLGPWETVSVYRQSLVLNAAPGTLDRISVLLKDLDRPLRNLMIAVRRAGPSHAEAEPDDGSVTISTRSRDSSREVRALESTPLLLREGRLLPMPQGGLLGPYIRWEELQANVALSVRLSGEQVILDVDLRDDTIDQRGLRKNSVRTTVSGRLGEWIRIGETSGHDTSEADADGISTGPRAAGAYDIRVELAP